jgi:hypothetical protein
LSYFHRVVKSTHGIQTLAQEAREVLQEALARFGEITENQWIGRALGAAGDPGYDLKVGFKVTKDPGRGQTSWIHAVIKSVVHPKQASHAIWSLKKSPGRTADNVPVYPVLIAPFISEAVAAMCEAEGIGHLDLSGNCNLEFGGIWIERRGIPRKYKEDRGLKSLYSPKASRILRVLLQGPLRPHKVEELFAAATVSLGLVSKVRKVLLDQDLGEDSKDGIRIKGNAAAHAILRDWLREDNFSQRVQVREYSTLASDSTLASHLASFCAAHHPLAAKEPLFTLNFGAWLRAPHNVPTVVSAYLDQFPDETEFLSFLNARPVSRGAGNLRIIVPDDYLSVSIGHQRLNHHPDLTVVSDLQLVLDLNGGEPNGVEQAAVLQKRPDFNGGWA